jgi:hypothetical protein
MPPSPDRAAFVRELLAEIEEAARTQPERLTRARERVEDERIKALAEESWVDVVTGISTVDHGTGEVNGMFSVPTIEGEKLFGTRLAFDLLGGGGDEDQVAEKLREFRTMIRDPAHLVLVFAAALDILASYVVPDLLDSYERMASDYEKRVGLAEAAWRAWAARSADLRDGELGDE